jgi:hypothetical protein
MQSAQAYWHCSIIAALHQLAAACRAHWAYSNCNPSTPQAHASNKFAIILALKRQYLWYWKRQYHWQWQPELAKLFPAANNCCVPSAGHARARTGTAAHPGRH